MSELVVQATKRSVGKQAAKRIRRSGLVPGIFYASDVEPIPIAVRPLQLRPLVYTHESHVVRLEIEGGGTYECVLKDVSFDPVTDAIIHVDFFGISADRPAEFEVPVRLVGTPIGVQQGGLLEHVLHKVTVQCKPADLPEHVDVDVSHLKIGQAVHIGDISIPNVVLRHPPDVTIALVATRRAAEEITASLETQPTEPELVGQKGKKAEE